MFFKQINRILIFTTFCLFACTKYSEDKTQKNAVKWIEHNAPELLDFELTGFSGLDSAYYSMEQYNKLNKLKDEISYLKKVLALDLKTLDSSRIFYQKIAGGDIKYIKRLDISFAALDTALAYNYVYETSKIIQQKENEYKHISNEKKIIGYKCNFYVKVKDANNNYVDTVIYFYFNKFKDKITDADLKNVIDLMS